MKARTLTAAVLASIVATPALVCQVSAQTRGTRIAPDRYETLRALAEYVDDGAEFTLEEATDTLQNPGVRERALITSLREFARLARAFHARVDENTFRPWSVSGDLTRLRTAGRRSNIRLRRVAQMRDTYEDFDQILADIADMQKIAQGSAVQLRRPDPEWNARTDHEHPADAEAPAYGQADLQGQRLEDFRRLTRELDDQAGRVLAMARQQRGDYTGRGDQMMLDLEHFKRQVATIRTQTDTETVRPRDIGPLVAHILTDARKADTSMRSARVFMGVWDEWARAIQIMEQMSALVR